MNQIRHEDTFISSTRFVKFHKEKQVTCVHCLTKKNASMLTFLHFVGTFNPNFVHACKYKYYKMNGRYTTNTLH